MPAIQKASQIDLESNPVILKPTDLTCVLLANPHCFCLSTYVKSNYFSDHKLKSQKCDHEINSKTQMPPKGVRKISGS